MAKSGEGFRGFSPCWNMVETWLGTSTGPEENVFRYRAHRGRYRPPGGLGPEFRVSPGAGEQILAQPDAAWTRHRKSSVGMGRSRQTIRRRIQLIEHEGEKVEIQPSVIDDLQKKFAPAADWVSQVGADAIQLHYSCRKCHGTPIKACHCKGLGCWLGCSA